MFTISLAASLALYVDSVIVHVLTSNLNSSVLDTDNVTVGGVADRGGDGQAVHGRRGGEVRRLPRLGRVEGSVVFLVPVRGTLVFGDGDGFCLEQSTISDLCRVFWASSSLDGMSTYALMPQGVMCFLSETAWAYAWAPSFAVMSVIIVSSLFKTRPAVMLIYLCS